MAKRFTDTAKWDKSWYRKLGSKLRDVRQYMLDRCDHAGLIEVDYETFKHFIGESVSFDEISKAFKGNVIQSDDKLFFPDFIEFQYKCKFSELNPENKVHKSVIDRLNSMGLASPLQGAKDKEQEKDKVKEKEKEKAAGKFEIVEALASIEDEEVRAVLTRISGQAQETWIRKYKSPQTVEKHLRDAIDHHTSALGKYVHEIDDWGKKLVTWLRNQPYFEKNYRPLRPAGQEEGNEGLDAVYEKIWGKNAKRKV